jgi:2-(1,2-epoxy-1,2-dihydrophenyl)acetyl-CoA isomerase
MAGPLEIHDDGHLRVLRLDRPDRKNALDGPLFGALSGAFVDAARDPDVWAVVLTGNGSAFCAGLDLSTDAGDRDDHGDHGEDVEDGAGAAEAPPAPEREGPAPAEVMAKLMRVDCEKPIVAGVNGAAVGFGVALALAADIRIAGPSAKFHPGYARVGTSPDGGASWTVTQALGYERAMRFFLEERMVAADEALAIGLVSEVTATDDELDERLLTYGRKLASIAPVAAQQTKRLMARITAPIDLEEHLRTEVRLARHGLSTEDGAEALRAMFAKETPRFTGR